MKKVLYLALLAAFGLTSCKKSDANGDSGGNNNPTPTPDKFMTTTPGSTWNYQTVDNMTATTNPYTLTSTSTDSIINGRNYHIYTYADVNGTSSEYYSISGNDYYQYSELSAELPPLELKYLVDNVPVGTTWSQPLALSQVQQGVTLNFNATLKYTVEEKGASITVGSNTYTNAIKVKTEITNPSISSSLPVPITIEPITQNIYAYFAPKKGLVKREFQLKVDISAFGSVQNIIDNNTSTTLISSNIQ
jgi:hypothetical protein